MVFPMPEADYFRARIPFECFLLPPVDLGKKIARLKLCQIRISLYHSTLPSNAKFAGSGHEDVTVLSPLDIEVAASQMDRYVSFGESVERRRDGNGACAGPAGDGLACAAFPDAHFHFVLVQDLDEFQRSLYLERSCESRSLVLR